MPHHTIYKTTQKSLEITVPVWVEEKAYEIEVRAIAENCDNNSRNQTEENANISYNKYVATQKIPVEVVGKIYDLRVSSSNDPGWYQKIKNGFVKDVDFPFGKQGQNTVPQYKYAQRLGYSFMFDFKTKGRKSNNVDVSIEPAGFYFVSKTGGNAKKVDLYYTVKGEYKKISGTDTSASLNVKLAEEHMKVPIIERTDSNRIYLSELGKAYDYTKLVNIGNSFSQLKLPHDLRLCYNNFAEYQNGLYGNKQPFEIGQDAGSTDKVIGSVGHWYAGYRLPSTTIAVESGTTNVKEAVQNNKALKEGYILVKMNIKTKYSNGSGNWEYLQYKGPEALTEGGALAVDWTKTFNPNDSSASQTITLPNGQTAKIPNGVVALFEANMRANGDYDASGTH